MYPYPDSSPATEFRPPRRLPVLALLTATPLLPTPVLAVTKNFLLPTSDAWSAPAAWSPAGVPVPGDDVDLNVSPASPMTVDFDANYSRYSGNQISLTLNSTTDSPLTFLQSRPNSDIYSRAEIIGDTGHATYVQSASLNSLTTTWGAVTLGNAAGSSGTYSLSGTGSLSTYVEYIGVNGTGSFNQSGGTHTLGFSLGLAIYPGSSASYSLSAGSLSTTAEDVGDYGTASFAQSGGTHAVSDNLSLGFWENSAGSYSLSGTGRLSTKITDVGNYGTGSFSQSGGTHTVSYELRLGLYASATGTYSLSGTGTLTGGSTYVGYYGTGYFDHSAGTHAQTTRAVTLGGFAGSRGTYSLHGTGALLTSITAVGQGGTGLFSHSAGTHSPAFALYVGGWPGGQGTYSLSGTGTLATRFEYIGDQGTGSLIQTGGTNDVSSMLMIGAQTGSQGLYQLSAGTLSITGDLVVGGMGLTPGGSGTLSISGGSASASSALRIHPGSVARLSGGTLAVGSLILNGPQALDLAGGTLTLPHASPTTADALRTLLLNHVIFSSVLLADHPDPLSIGYADNGLTLRTQLTITGDANLDGMVNADDYILLDRTFACHLASAYWQDGDFNYDGTLDSQDYLLIDRTYALQGNQLSPDFLAMRESQFGVAYVSSLLTSIPEPASTAYLPAAGLLPLTPRRRRR